MGVPKWNYFNYLAGPWGRMQQYMNVTHANRNWGNMCVSESVWGQIGSTLQELIKVTHQNSRSEASLILTYFELNGCYSFVSQNSDAKPSTSGSILYNYAQLKTRTGYVFHLF